MLLLVLFIDNHVETPVFLVKIQSKYLDCLVKFLCKHKAFLLERCKTLGIYIKQCGKRLVEINDTILKNWKFPLKAPVITFCISLERLVLQYA